MIELLNGVARAWWGWAAAMFWQVGLLIVLIACLDRLIRRWAWPQLRYALWSLVLIKLILPPTMSLPSGVIPELRPLVASAVRWAERERPVRAESPATISGLGLPIADSVASAETAGDIIVPPLSGSRVEAPFPRVAEAPHGVNPQSAIANPQLTWQAIAMAIWVAGILTLGTWLLLRLYALAGRHASRAAAASLPQSFYNQMAGCAKRLGLRRVPRVIVVRKLATPAVFGVFRPVLLMPKGYLHQLSRKDTEHMLLHELAHIKRGDLIMHALYLLLQIVYWYNPLLWLVRRQLHHLRELSCDATVAGLLREQTAAYRRTLLETARRFLARSTEPGLGLLGLFEDSNRLLVRLNWLERPTWRYRTMKRVIAVAIAALMFACILPMAQGQGDAPVAIESEASDRAEKDLETARKLQELQTKLEKLELERLTLQKELQQLAQTRSAVTEAKPTPADPKETEAHVPHATHAPDATHDAEYWQQWAKGMQAWAEQMQQWQQSEEMQQWQKQMQKWGEEQGKIYRRQFGDAVGVTPMPTPQPIPAMPPMPPMPAMPEMPAEVVVPVPPPTHLHAPRIPEVVVPKTKPPKIKRPTDGAPAEGIRPPILPGPRDDYKLDVPAQSVDVSRTSDGKYVATKRMGFVGKVNPGSPFVLENTVGNIVLSPSKDGTYDITAVMRATASTAGQARAMVEQIAMSGHTGPERFYLKPVKGNNKEWKNLTVDLHVTVPAGAHLDIKTNLGDVHLNDLRGQIKALTNLGSIRAVNSSGQLDLTSNMGDIEFVAARDLSATLKASTAMGSIESELPLDVTRDMMSAQIVDGVVGTGDDSIQLTTSMGAVRLKWQPSSDVGL
jgi:beta-lactamase regulating signal transducer with metallopeptidase domain